GGRQLVVESHAAKGAQVLAIYGGVESVARQGRQEGAGGVSEVGLGIAECACQQVVIHDNKSRFLGTKSLRMTTREEGGDRVSAAYEPSSTRLRDPPPRLHRTCLRGTSIQT